MSKKVLKAVALSMAAALALSLAACGGSSSSSTAASSTAASSTAASAATSGDAASGRPEGYPEKDITYICAFAAGSSHDVYFRLLAEKVREMQGWDHSIVVEYKEGASGDVGWTALAQAANDGYTIGFFPTAALINGVSSGRPYSTEGVDNVMGMMADPGVIGVAANSKYNSLEELVAAAKEKPGSVSIGVTSVTTSEGLAVTQLEDAAGVEFNVIPFDGESAVLTAVSGGHCDAFCLNVSDGKTFVDNGQVKYLATGDTERSSWYPDLPTYQECGYDVVQYNCRGIAIREGADPAIIKYLSNCFQAAAAQPDVIAKAEEMQITAVSMGTEECNRLFEEQNQIYLDLWETNPWN